MHSLEKTIRKQSTAASDIFLDHSLLSMPILWAVKLRKIVAGKAPFWFTLWNSKKSFYRLFFFFCPAFSSHPQKHLCTLTLTWLISLFWFGLHLLLIFTCYHGNSDQFRFTFYTFLYIESLRLLPSRCLVSYYLQILFWLKHKRESSPHEQKWQRL